MIVEVVSKSINSETFQKSLVKFFKTFSKSNRNCQKKQSKFLNLLEIKGNLLEIKGKLVEIN